MKKLWLTWIVLMASLMTLSTVVFASNSSTSDAYMEEFDEMLESMFLDIGYPNMEDLLIEAQRQRIQQLEQQKSELLNMIRAKQANISELSEMLNQLDHDSEEYQRIMNEIELLNESLVMDVQRLQMIQNKLVEAYALLANMVGRLSGYYPF